MVHTAKSDMELEEDSLEKHLNEVKTQLFDLFMEGIVIIDSESEAPMTIIYVNRGFERMTGWKSADVLGTTLEFLQGKDTNQHGVQTIQMGLEKGLQVHVLLLNYRLNRTSFWNSIYTVPLPSQGSSVSPRVAQ